MIYIGLPFQVGKEIEELAKEQRRPVGEILKEAFRQYRAQRNFRSLAKETQRLVKTKGLTPKDFGGPFED